VHMYASAGLAQRPKGTKYPLRQRGGLEDNSAREELMHACKIKDIKMRYKTLFGQDVQINNDGFENLIYHTNLSNLKYL